MIVKQRKGLASLGTFSLILLLLFSLFFLTLAYYESSKESAYTTFQEKELLNSLLSLRSDLIQTTSLENTTLNYSRELDSDSTLFFLNSSYLEARESLSSRQVKVNVSSLGLDFCSDYNLSPVIEHVFSFNGSCLSMSTS